MQGNKGAVALQLTVGGTVLSFVNAHLAAFDEGLDRRNADFHDLSRRLVFAASPSTATASSADDPSDTASASAEEPQSVYEADALFWLVSTSDRFTPLILSFDAYLRVVREFKCSHRAPPILGIHPDLNYRLDMPDADVRELLSGASRETNLKDLLSCDQVSRGPDRNAFKR